MQRVLSTADEQMTADRQKARTCSLAAEMAVAAASEACWLSLTEATLPASLQVPTSRHFMVDV